MKEKEARQATIKSLVAERRIKTQEDMIQALRERGIGATQATLSRDMVDLSIVKAQDGCYIYEGDLKFARLAKEFVTSIISAGNIVIIKCTEGAASGVAAAFDRLSWQEVLGSVAGDDTILLVTSNLGVAISVKSRLSGLIET